MGLELAPVGLYQALEGALIAGLGGGEQLALSRIVGFETHASHH